METDAQLAARRVGESVGRYRLERVLGVGGMAAVYAGYTAEGTWAAIKILHAEMSMRRDVRERFYREGYVANSIQHPGVVFVLEHGDAGEAGAFLAMELLQGETLTDRVRRYGTLPIPELLDIADQVLDVLRSAHDKGIIHRDLKPDNLFATYNGQIKILDFGLARLADGAPGEHRTRSGVALGTLPYMAPEQALGRRAEVDGRVDLFALGATLFRILAGRKIHEAESEAELLMAMASKPAVPLASVCPQLPGHLCKIVDLALAFSRDARYPDAATMQADVRAFRAGSPPPYALARSSQRDEKTRMEPAFDPAATSSSRGPQGTMPLAQHPGAAALSSRAGLQFGQTSPAGGAADALGQTYPSAGAPHGGGPGYAPAAPPAQALVGHLGQTYPSAGGGASPQFGVTRPAGSAGVSAGAPGIVNAAPSRPAPAYPPGFGVVDGLGQTYPSAGAAITPQSSNVPVPASAPGVPSQASPKKSLKILWVVGLLALLVSVGMAALAWRVLGAHAAGEPEPLPSASAASSVAALATTARSAGRDAPSALPSAGTASPPSPLATASAASAPEAPRASGARRLTGPGSGSSVSSGAARAAALASASPAASADGSLKASAPAAAAAPPASPAPTAVAPAAAPAVAPPPAAAPAPAAPPPAEAAPADPPRSVLPPVRGKRNQN